MGCKGIMAKSNDHPGPTPVINYKDRVYQLVHIVQDDIQSPVVRVRDTHITKILPGLSYIAPEVLLEAGFNPKDFRNAVVVQSPLTLPDDQALSLVERTSSKSALATWAEAETRLEILAAIKSRLSQQGGRALRD